MLKVFQGTHTEKQCIRNSKERKYDCVFDYVQADSFVFDGNKLSESAETVDAADRIIDKAPSKKYEIRENAKSYIITTKKRNTHCKIKDKFEKYVINDYKYSDSCKKSINVSLTKSEKKNIAVIKN